MSKLSKRPEKLHIDKIIGSNISVERKARNFSRDELAEALKVSASHLGLIERGERGVNALNLIKISTIFDITVDTLLSGTVDSSLPLFAKHGDAEQANIKKINSLLSCLKESEMLFVLHTIKGIIAMSQHE